MREVLKKVKSRFKLRTKTKEEKIADEKVSGSRNGKKNARGCM